jgi:hypothetical protein
MSEAIAAAGTYLSLGNGVSPETFTEVAEVRTIGGPNPDSEEIDVTHLRSPARTREYLQSFLIPGEIPLTLNFIPNSTTANVDSAALIALYAAGTVRNWTVTYPDGSVDAFAAYVKSCPRPANVGEALVMNPTLRVSGAIEFTAAA